MATTNFKGQPVKLIGEFIQVGKVAPDFELVKTDLSSFSLKDLNGENGILNIFPSLDTSVKQFIQLISIVEGSFVPVSSRYYQLVHRVLWYQFHFYSVGECGMQCQIILLCGTALAATIQFVVEIVLNVVMIDLSKCEIRIVFVNVLHVSLANPAVTKVCGTSYIRFDVCQPLGKEIIEQHI